MANKRFTFADAKAKIKELEDALEEKALEVKELVDDITLDDSDNVYNKRENTIIQIYKFGFWILLGLNILQLAL
jgi:hypothetical protein